MNFLPGVGEEIGPTLVDHPDVALIAFTGSLGVGLWINETASKTPPGQDHVKRVIAEMGGKNAVIVDADADLDEAVKGVADSAFGYQGQKCSAGSRAIVLEPVYDAFLARLIEATKSLTVGPGRGARLRGRPGDRRRRPGQHREDDRDRQARGPAGLRRRARVRSRTRATTSPRTSSPRWRRPRRSPRKRSSGRCCRSSRPATWTTPWRSPTGRSTP